MTHKMKVEPEKLANILSDFGIDHADIQEIPTLTRCSVFKAAAASGNYAVKVYPPEYSQAELGSELAFVETLSQGGAPVPRYQRNDSGGLYVDGPNGIHVTAYKWIEGNPLKKYDHHHIATAVNTIARIHIATPEKPIERPDQWLWDDARRCLEKVQVPRKLKDIFYAAIQEGCPWDGSVAINTRHNDYAVSNILWPNDEATPSIIDFTNTICAPAEWDLAILYAGLSLSGVCDHIPITPQVITRPYESAGSAINYDLFNRFLKAAITQRTVFRVLNSNQSDADLVWHRAEVGLKYGNFLMI